MPRHEELIAEREALDELLRSEGWAVFERRVQNEAVGEGYFGRMQKAIQSDDPLRVKVVHNTAMELLKMLKWPRDRVVDLKGTVE